MTEQPSHQTLEDICKANGIYEQVIGSLLSDGSILDVDSARLHFVGVHRYKYVGKQGLDSGVDLVVAATGKTGVRNNLLFPLEEGKPFISNGQPLEPDQYGSLMNFVEDTWTVDGLLFDTGILEKLHRAYERKQINPVESGLRVTNLTSS